MDVAAVLLTECGVCAANVCGARPGVVGGAVAIAAAVPCTLVFSSSAWINGVADFGVVVACALYGTSVVLGGVAGAAGVLEGLVSARGALRGVARVVCSLCSRCCRPGVGTRALACQYSRRGRHWFGAPTQSSAPPRSELCSSQTGRERTRTSGRRHVARLDWCLGPDQTLCRKSVVRYCVSVCETEGNRCQSILTLQSQHRRSGVPAALRKDRSRCFVSPLQQPPPPSLPACCF